MSEEKGTAAPAKGLLPGDAPQAVALEFEGIIRRIPFRLVGNWLIDNKVVQVTPGTLIEGEPAMGRLAEVTAFREPDGTIRAARIDAIMPDVVPEPWLGYLRSSLGMVALLSLLLPCLIAIYPFLPDYGGMTLVMTVLVCLGIFAAAYSEKRILYEQYLRQSVRGAQGLSIRLISLAALAAAMIIGFVAAMGGMGYLREALPSLLARFVVPPLQILVFAGLTLFFSVNAALKYMASLEAMGAYQRPLYLRGHVDPVGLGMQTLTEQLGIPAEVEWRITERSRQSDGGAWFIISWTERSIKYAQDGSQKEVVEEKAYEVRLSASGGVISFSPSN